MNIFNFLLGKIKQKLFNIPLYKPLSKKDFDINQEKIKVNEKIVLKNGIIVNDYTVSYINADVSSIRKTVKYKTSGLIFQNQYTKSKLVIIK